MFRSGRGGDDPLSFADGTAPKRIENDIVKKPEEKVCLIVSAESKHVFNWNISGVCRSAIVQCAYI